MFDSTSTKRSSGKALEHPGEHQHGGDRHRLHARLRRRAHRQHAHAVEVGPHALGVVGQEAAGVHGERDGRLLREPEELVVGRVERETTVGERRDDGAPMAGVDGVAQFGRRRRPRSSSASLPAR